MTTTQRLMLACIAIALSPAIAIAIFPNQPQAVDWFVGGMALIAGLIIGLAERFFAGDDIKRMPGLIAEHSRLSSEHDELQQALDRLHDVVVTNAVRQRSGKDAADNAGRLLRRLRQRRVLTEACQK